MKLTNAELAERKEFSYIHRGLANQDVLDLYQTIDSLKSQLAAAQAELKLYKPVEPTEIGGITYGNR